MPTIREAKLEDARALAELAERTFRDTFGPVNRPEDMALHCATTYGEALQSAEIADPQRLTLVAEDGASLVGFAQLRWGTAPPCVLAKHPGELQRLYVIAPWHGRGLAQALMKTSLDAMRKRGSDVAWLGVWEHNPRAIAFYKKLGFVEVGEHVFPLGTDPQRDLVMARPIDVA